MGGLGWGWDVVCAANPADARTSPPQHAACLTYLRMAPSSSDRSPPLLPSIVCVVYRGGVVLHWCCCARIGFLLPAGSISSDSSAAAGVGITSAQTLSPRHRDAARRPVQGG